MIIRNCLNGWFWDQLTRLVIANAIYFKGTWNVQFNAEYMRADDFFINSDDVIKTYMMALHGDNYFDYAKTDTAEILKVPYDGKKVSMLVILPYAIGGLASVEKQLYDDGTDMWSDKTHKTKIDKVIFPKFKLETNYNLKPMLQTLGVIDAFKPKHADFAKITQDEKLHVSQAIHKAFVDVNEEGTEAAAVTVIDFTDESLPIGPPPKYFIANHPFIFVIQDDTTGNILFMGKIVNPSASN